MNIIEIDNAVKSFKGHKVLNGVSMCCEQGKIYGIVGYNGSGKTVLFKCLCGILQLDQGEVYINGVKKKNGEILRDIGIIIEGPAFIKEKSAYKNLEYLYEINHKSDKKLIFKVIEKVGLNPNSRKAVGKYSMGMKQRLAIAQAIMEDASILILDEPMNGLDKNGVREIRNLFLELKNNGKTILMASHNKDDIDILCDEVYEMEDGQLVKIQ